MENVERGSLELADEARAYEELVKVWGSQSEVAKRTGIRQQHISDVINSYRLAVGLGIRAMYKPTDEEREKGTLPFEHARLLQEVERAVPRIPEEIQYIASRA